jgi:hypothetical protein
MFDKFSIQNGLMQENALLPLLCSFALKYAVRKIKNTPASLLCC